MCGIIKMETCKNHINKHTKLNSFHFCSSDPEGGHGQQDMEHVNSA
jgi:hypothetical protein